jgi:hypothetical protein
MSLPRTKRPGFAARIQIVLETTGWSKSRLAREAGAKSDATVHNWLSRDGSMQPAHAFALQDRHGWNARWLIEGVGPPRIERLSPESEKILQRIRELPEDRRRALALLLDL